MTCEHCAARYAVGEMARLCDPASRFHNAIMTVVGPLTRGTLRNIETGSVSEDFAYPCEGPWDGVYYVRPHDMRKIPPNGLAARWEDCVWRPKVVEDA